MSEVYLRQFGMGMTSAIIIEWRKKVGDHVNKGEILVEAEAAKSTIEIEAPESGILSDILADPDDDVPINTVIAIIKSDN